MANNLHISYDLYRPGQNYDDVVARIRSLGASVKVHLSFWYVNSKMTANQAADHVWAVMDQNDKLYVVDATNNDAAWYNLSDEVTQFIQKNWYA